MNALALGLLAQIAIPNPVGYVNDFAHVIDTASARQMEAIITEVRAKTRGDIAVVTLPDIGDRSAVDVAVQIGRQWGVGGQGAAGDPAKNLGVVILLVPRKNHQPGTGTIFIATGRGAEGFLTDARTGAIRDGMGPWLQREEYGPALLYAVKAVAQAYAQEFGVKLTGVPATPVPAPEPRGGIPIGIIILILVILLLSRGRGLLLPFMLGGMGGGRRGGWSSGGWGGRGGGGGGGFGGFGGGGGFSGGGAGGRF